MRCRPFPSLFFVSLGLLLGACAGASDRRPPITGRPPIPPGVSERHLHFSDATVGRGDQAPDFSLPAARGDGQVTLSSLRGRPLVLVFGSHTCNVFARDVPALKRLYDETHAHAGFLLVYVREAHATDEWVMPDNEARGLRVPQPQSAPERASAAQACIADYGLPMPTVVDTMDDAVSKQYGGWPDRLYVLDADGRIAYQSGVGPFGFQPDRARAFLREKYGF